MHLVKVLDATVRRRPSHAALRWGEQQITYAQLRAAADRAATVFAEHGVGERDTVAVMTTNDPGFVIAAYGLWRLGAVLVPVNHKLTAPEVGRQVEHCEARLGVVSTSLREVAEEGAGGLTWLTTDWELAGSFDRAVREAGPYEGPFVDHEAVAQILYTSGTTSAPKGCVLTHRAVSMIGPFNAASMPFDHHDRFLMAMPIWHASPLNNWLLGMMFVGATTVLMREYDPLRFLDLLERERITAVFGAPVAFLAPLDAVKAQGRAMSDYDLSAADKLIYGAAPLGADSARMLMEAYGTENFYQVYGMSETGPSGTQLNPEDQLRKAGSIGRGGMLGVDLKVVDFEGTTVDHDGIGEIWLSADCMMEGYYKDPEATARVFEGGWYRTGDVARVDQDGYVYVVDRLKDVIITGGENVYSTEVEEAIRRFDEISDVAVVGRPHPTWGQTVVAVVVTSDPELTVESLRARLEGTLAHYKIPKDVKLVRELPRNPSGKLLKHRLRETVGD